MNSTDKVGEAISALEQAMQALRDLGLITEEDENE
jgi:hypothetical protein